MDGSQNNPISRRDFLKKTGFGVAATASALMAVNMGKAVSAAEKAINGKRYAMVIDLQKCVGCGGCMVACKVENNVRTGVAWSFKDLITKGKYPNVRYEYIPRLCNHCENAPCVEVCPTEAMHKEEGGVTAHTPADCIGCKLCLEACPYTDEVTGKGVISFNDEDKETHEFWRNKKTLIKGCTQSSTDVTASAGGNVLPYYNPDKEKFREGSGLRTGAIVEKCTFCDHRLKQGLLPACVLRCPPGARIFGDINDPNSEPSKVLAKYRSWRLKEEEGTSPQVYYVRDFNPGVYETLEERHQDMSEVEG